MNTTQNSFELGCIRLVRHWLLMGYGRICHAVWLRLPDSIAMHSRLGSHALAWGGYWANMPWSMPNRELWLRAVRPMPQTQQPAQSGSLHPICSACCASCKFWYAASVPGGKCSQIMTSMLVVTSGSAYVCTPSTFACSLHEPNGKDQASRQGHAANTQHVE